MYRIAELVEDRREAFAEQLAVGDLTMARARTEVDRSIDRIVWYAGWCDKFAQVYGNLNPVAGPFFNISSPEPTGVVGVIAPSEPALSGLVTRIGPALAGGNTLVVLASELQPLASITLAEVMEAADMPAGVVNILTGSPAELVPWLADHMDVNGIDATGADQELRMRIDQGSVHNVKRVVAVEDPEAQSPYLIAAFTELKTVWHPKGL
jgi:acyl-CoA reductase-like NAD-dependent aldehyde dehydrogenase